MREFRGLSDGAQARYLGFSCGAAVNATEPFWEV
jgi:hypothetical protein